MAKYQSTKTYGTDRGLSCCFRQWRASHSHCSTLHGYSLGFKFVFESETLDSRNWAFDFGGMKPIKQYLDHMFDHTVLVAEDDPALSYFVSLANLSDAKGNGIGYNAIDEDKKPYERGALIDLRIVPGVGCEMTAKMVYDKSVEILNKMKSGEDTRYEINPDVRLLSVECFEHGSNSAIYFGDSKQTVYEKVKSRPNYTAYVTNESTTVAADHTGLVNVKDFSYLTGNMKVFLDKDDITCGHGVTYRVYDEKNMRLDFNTETGEYRVGQLTGDVGSAAIEATMPCGRHRIMRRFTVSKVRAPEPAHANSLESLLGFVNKLDINASDVAYWADKLAKLKK